ncbi:MAG: DoxX family protein [Coxiellaceae bacterium]|nr:DoxX family protein [Coxiellaceae bacterium]
MNGFVRGCSKVVAPIVRVLDLIAPLIDLIIRIWIARFFFEAAIMKMGSWQQTILMFQHQYHVGFLSPAAAAVIGTGAELVLSLLLVLGLGGRISILIFFLYNAIVAASFPHLWTPEGAGGLAMHVSWGLLLALLMVHGPGKISLDHLIARWHQRNSDRLESDRMRRFHDMSGTRN